ncbi:MAG: hypothetical protein AAF613_10050 [Pseudomonadota bacterium]
MTEPSTAPETPTATDAFFGSGLDKLSALRVYTHSPILYWWPVWLLGFVFLFFQGTGLLNEDAAARVQGQTFVFTLVFVIFSTTVRLRGANSVIFGLLLAIGLILLFTANLSAPVASFLGGLDIRMSASFYGFMGITVFLMWAIMVFGFDKVKFYDVAPGQVHQRVVWGTGDRAESGANVRCTYKKDDFLRHRMLGLGITGDIEISFPNNEVWELHNVFFAKSKARRINELIVTRPVD